MKELYFAAVNLESLDLSLEALFLWIKFTLAALSKAEKTFCKAEGDFWIRAFLTKFLSSSFFFKFLLVRTLSLCIFFMAEATIGILVMVT